MIRAENRTRGPLSLNERWDILKQAENGQSRRQYLRLKIVKKGGGGFDFKKFPKKNWKMWFLNSVTVPKNVKGGGEPLEFFDIHCFAKKNETNEGGPFGAIQKISKKVA